MANEWYYARDGQKFGPVSGKRLKELATIGVVRRNDLIWSPGYAVWRPAKKFRGLLPKMDATSLSPAMSLFWRPGQVEGEPEDRLKGLFLEPDSPATSITPPLPPAASRKASASAAPAVNSASGGNHPTPRTIRRPSGASVAEPVPAPAQSASASRASTVQAAQRPVVTVAAQPRGTWAGMSTKEKLAIAGGLLTMLVIYGVLVVKALF
jgi:hypothetical protein